MKPSAFKRLQRAVEALISKDADRCSICERSLPHNTRTYGGADKAGTPVIAGECCSSKVATTVLQGVYMAQDFGNLGASRPNGSAKPISPAKIDEAISALQDLGNARSAQRVDVAQRAGVDPGRTKLFLEDSPWKSDDALWFKENTKRSHRLREAYANEYGEDGLDAPPSDHRMFVVVRQVQPGMRVRTPFWRNMLFATPDDEATLHTMFDQFSQFGPGQVVTHGQIDRGARAMRGKADQKPN